MSFEVDVKKVTGVLLAGGWSEVYGSSFEIHSAPAVLVDEKKELGSFAGGAEGRVAASWITEGNERVTCHLSEILALKWSKEGRKWDSEDKA